MLGKSIREASSPLRNAGGFLGMFLFDFEKFYFNRLYMIAIWTLYAYTIVRVQIFLLREGQFTSIVGTSLLYANWTILLVTVLFNVICKKSSEKCFKALCIVDDTLKSLGLSPEYQTTYRDSLITLALLFVVSLGAVTFTSISISNFNSLAHILCVVSMFGYPSFLTNINDYSYWIVLRSMADRFAQLNQYMNNLSAHRENHGRSISKNTCFILNSQRKNNSRNDQPAVWIIMKLHRQLNKISREINRMFSLSFGLQLGASFFITIELISTLYLTWVKLQKIGAKKSIVIVSHVAAHFLYFTKLIVINFACEDIQKKSSGMEAVLTNYINTVHDTESWQQIHLFLMQVKQRPLQFTAMGFINLGFKCLSSMCTSMAEVVIIMIQLGAISHATYIRPERNITIRG